MLRTDKTLSPMFVTCNNLVMYYNLNVSTTTSDIAATILLFMKFTNIYCHRVFCYQWVFRAFSLLLYKHLILQNCIVYILNNTLNIHVFFFKMGMLGRHGFTNEKLLEGNWHRWRELFLICSCQSTHVEVLSFYCMNWNEMDLSRCQVRTFNPQNSVSEVTIMA